MQKSKKSSVYKKKLNILKLSKNIIVKNGWNENSLKVISEKTNFSLDELNVLFPDGYKDLLIFSLDEINLQLENYFKKYNLIRLPLHKRIRKILITKINLLNKNKNFYKKIFFFLILPHNSRLLSKQLYKSVDLIWFIAGDHSTDFNYYTKRIILLGIYSRVILNFFNNNDLKKLEELIDVNLNYVSKIPQLKKRLNLFKENIPSIFSILKKI